MTSLRRTLAHELPLPMRGIVAFRSIAGKRQAARSGTTEHSDDATKDDGLIAGDWPPDTLAARDNLAYWTTKATSGRGPGVD